MTLAHAMALCGQAHAAPLDASADVRAMRRLARRLMRRFAPRIGLDDVLRHPRGDIALPDGLLLDIAGCEHLFGDASGLLAMLSAELTGLGLTHTLAAAGPRGAAWGLARFGQGPMRMIPPRASPEAIAQAVSSLPVESLRLEAATCQAMREVGLSQVGEVMRLPRASIPSRFGAIVLDRLDAMLGLKDEAIRPVVIRPALRLERVFEGPTTRLEMVHAAVQQLLELLSRELARQERGVTVLECRLLRLGADARGIDPVSLETVLSGPTRDATHLERLLAPRVEKIHLGFGIEGVCLIAHRTARLAHRQLAHVDTGMGDDTDAQAAHRLIDTLSSRLGEHRVVRLRTLQTHDPRRLTQLDPAVRSTGEAPCTAMMLPRPGVLLDPPEPAEAVFLQPDHPPTRLCWRGTWHDVRLGLGPERLAGEWWRGQDEGRDYFRLQLAGGVWVWASRQIDAGGWRVEGVWG